jgi:hypothetical protein
MDIDRFLAKPVEVEIHGEKVMIKPLTTEFYPLTAKLSFYTQRILSARSKLKKGETLNLEGLFTVEELGKRAEIEKEIAYQTFKLTFEGITREKFNEFKLSVIDEIMKGAMKANGFTDEKLEEIQNALIKNDKQD